MTTSTQVRNKDASPRPCRVHWLGVSTRALVALAATVAVPHMSHAQRGTTARAAASVRIVSLTTATLNQSEALTFGHVRGGPQDGSVVITPNNRRVVEGQARVSSPQRRTQGFSAGHYQIQGAPGIDYELTAPRRVVARGRRGTTLVVTDFVLFTDNLSTYGGVGRLDRDGRDRISLGARLVVPANAPAGAYRVEVPLTVAYN